MPVSREQFDADLTAFTAEDAEVQAALTAVNDAKSRTPTPKPNP